MIVSELTPLKIVFFFYPETGEVISELNNILPSHIMNDLLILIHHCKKNCLFAMIIHFTLLY